MNLRKRKKYEVFKANTNRYKKSAVPYMRNLLNQDFEREAKHEND